VRELTSQSGVTLSSQRDLEERMHAGGCGGGTPRGLERVEEAASAVSDMARRTARCFFLVALALGCG
jgi:hypothetical protein